MQTLKKGSRGDEVKTLQKALNLIEDGIFGPVTVEAVKEFQQGRGLVADGIAGPKTWAALGITEAPLAILKSKRAITEIIVHCSATAEGKDYTVDDIRRWHKANGWSDIGYHYVVYRDGSVHAGRSVDLIGTHCAGHNAKSIGVNYIGGCASDGKTPKDTRTPEQKLALVSLLKDLRKTYPTARIYGHRDFSSKACPSFDAKKEYESI